MRQQFDRLGRSFTHLVCGVAKLGEPQTGLLSPTEAIDATTPADRQLFAVMAASPNAQLNPTVSCQKPVLYLT